MSTLSDRAMLAELSVTQWSARKLDRRITDQVNSEHNAAADACRVNKLLVPKESLAEVQAAISAARDEHAKRTLAWRDNGPRILSAAGYLAYADAMRRHRHEIERKADEFAAAYPGLVASAPARMNGLYDPADYPAASEIRGRFRFSVVISPVPAADDFRVTVGAEAEAAIRADIESRAAEALAASKREIGERITELAGRMVERLRATRTTKDGGIGAGIFRDSLVENVRELAELIPSLNIDGDPALAEIGRRMAAELAAHAPAELRESAELRASVADAASAILDELAPFMA